MRHALRAFVAVLVPIVAVAFIAGSGNDDRVLEARAGFGAPEAPSWIDPTDGITNVAVAGQMYAEAILQALADEQARAAAAARPRSSGGGRRVGGTVGECTGFAIPDYIIQRESGGNPSAYNPSGAYGCAQTLLSHYSSGSCQGLDPQTIDGQRECVNRLSNGGTNLQPWAATR